MARCSFSLATTNIKFAFSIPKLYIASLVHSCTFPAKLVNFNSLVKAKVPLFVKILYNFCYLLGKSLLWVGALLLSVAYIYALVTFIFFRESFDNTRNILCENLADCFFSVTRFGMIDHFLVYYSYSLHFWEDYVFTYTCNLLL